MTFFRTLAIAVAAFTGITAHAQEAGEASCILAGRLSDDAKWAPRFAGVQLLGQDGRAVTGAGKQALSGVRQVRLASPALLARCDGNGEVATGPETPGPKARVPALGPGVAAVEAVHFPRLRRGGELVELKLAVPADRVTLVTR